MAAKLLKNPWRKIKTRKGLVSRAEIRRVVERIIEEFHPEQVYLFGSYAYGNPDADSDVDLLVVMPARNTLDQAARIHIAADPSFAFDVIVRTPYAMEWRLREGDWFLREIVQNGILCHDKANQRVAAKGPRGFVGGSRAATTRRRVS
jgi:predicted nucleotidyltransferase